jgi:hypothetical protein
MCTRSGAETVDAAPASEMLDHTSNHSDALDPELIPREFDGFVPPMSSL